MEKKRESEKKPTRAQLKSVEVTALKIMQNIRIQMKYRHKKVLSFNFDSDYIDTVFNIAYAYEYSEIPAHSTTTHTPHRTEWELVIREESHERRKRRTIEERENKNTLAYIENISWNPQTCSMHTISINQICTLTQTFAFENEMKFCVLECDRVVEWQSEGAIQRKNEFHHQYGERDGRKKKYHYRPPELFTWIKHFFRPCLVVFVYFISFCLAPLLTHCRPFARFSICCHSSVKRAHFIAMSPERMSVRATKRLGKPGKVD